MNVATYADLKKFAAFYEDIASYFFIFCLLTWFEMRSYYHYRGNTIPWNRITKCPSPLLLTEDIGEDKTPSDATLDDCMEFVNHYLHNRKPNKDLVVTNI